MNYKDFSVASIPLLIFISAIILLIFSINNKDEENSINYTQFIISIILFVISIILPVYYKKLNLLEFFFNSPNFTNSNNNLNNVPLRSFTNLTDSQKTLTN